MIPAERNDRDLKRPRSHSLDRAPLAKRPHHWVPSEEYWDTLPRIYLTHQALVEHDRRSRQQTLGSAPFRRRQSTRLRQSTQVKSPNTEAPSLELRRFARHGGPDITAIRGFPDPTMSDHTSRPSKRTTTSGLTPSSKKSSPYDANYQLKLAQTGILLTEEMDENDDIVFPTNYDEITERLMETRASLSPSRFTEEDFKRFRKQTNQAILEGGIMQKSIAVIEGAGVGIYSVTGEGPFNNLEPFDPELAMAKPDSYDGAQPISIDRRVLQQLDKHIVPNTDTSRPAAPNFFVEGKSKQGRADVGTRQAAHAGAIGARGMMSIQNYPQAPTFDGNAYSFTSTYHHGQLRMYTSHARAPQSSEQLPQYYMSQIGAYAMTHNSKTFREGAAAYRNARDLAKEQRDNLIDLANQAARNLLPSENHVNRVSAANNVEEEQDRPAEDLASNQIPKRLRIDDDQDDQDDIVTTSSQTHSHDTMRASSRNASSSTSQMNFTISSDTDTISTERRKSSQRGASMRTRRSSRMRAHHASSLHSR